MNKSIYQIENEYRLLAENLIDNGGELTPEIETQLSITYEELQQKGVAYSFVIKDQIEIIKQIDEEIDRLEKRKKAKEKAVERLKETLCNAMEVFGVQKLESPIVTISLRPSESVEVLHLALLDEEYKKCSTPVWSADKVKIKQAFKDGKTIQGALLIKKQSIQIK